MNDDRKFRERAELVKELFLAGLPVQVIAKLANISVSTVSSDRARVEKLYGIKLPNPCTSAEESAKRFRKLLKKFLTVKFESRDFSDPLFNAALIMIDFGALSEFISSVDELLGAFHRPNIVVEDEKLLPYKELLEELLPDEYVSRVLPFYKALHTGEICMDRVCNYDDLRRLFISYVLKEGRSHLNTMTVTDPKMVIEKLFEFLSDRAKYIIIAWYGLDGKKRTTEEIASSMSLTRERVRQIRLKAFDIMKSHLDSVGYLLNSHDEFEAFKQKYDEFKQEFYTYRNLCEKRLDEFAAIKDQILNVPLPLSATELGDDDSRIVLFLVKRIEDIELSSRAFNCVRYCYEYVVDLVENWEKLVTLRNFGKKSYMAIDSCFDRYHIDRHKITESQIYTAKAIISRLVKWLNYLEEVSLF